MRIKNALCLFQSKEQLESSLTRTTNELVKLKL